jgi:putative DNA primase/helicase
LQYERERIDVAARLQCRPAWLDRVVKALRVNGTKNSGQGRPLQLFEPQPWTDHVDGSSLLLELSAAIRRHVILGQTEADAVALWLVATHAFDAFAIFPRLLVTGPEKGCGKSTLHRVISCCVPRPLSVSNVTASSLFRAIEAARPTLLLDEADAYARDNEDLRSVLDAGHARDGAVLRNGTSPARSRIARSLSS